MSDAEKAIIATEGSRDEARRLLRLSQQKLYEAAQEIEKLHQEKPRDVTYRRASAHVAAAIAAIELARIEMRKRKLIKQDPKVEVPNGAPSEQVVSVL